jgi:hypothetical protein
MAATAAATVPATIGGFSLATHWGGGFHWLAAAGLLSIPGALYGARVLLVETLSFHQRGDFVVTGDHKVTALLNWGHQRRAVRPPRRLPRGSHSSRSRWPPGYAG